MEEQNQVFSETACLVLKGPKAIIPEAQIVNAHLDRTWIQLLTEDLHLPITEGQIFVFSSKYTPSSPKEGEGWRSELGDKIGEFVRKFKKEQRQYTVRLCDPKNFFPYQGNSIHGDNARYEADQSTSLTFTSTAFRSHGPAIVIPSRQGAAPITPRTRVRSAQQNGRPLYVHGANVTPSTPTTHHEYSTRLKRRLEESSMTNNTDGDTEVVRQTKQTRREEPSVIQRYQMQSMEVPGPSVHQIQDVTSVVKRELNLGEEEEDEGEEEEEEWSRNWDEEPRGPVVRRGCQANGNVGSVGNCSNAHNDDELPHDIQMDEFDGDSDNSANDADNDSLCTATAVEEEELRNAGIPLQPLKPFAEDRLHNRFSNTFLLRIKDEIAELKRNNLWDRSVKRGPLSCYFLTELFKEF